MAPDTAPLKKKAKPKKPTKRQLKKIRQQKLLQVVTLWLRRLGLEREWRGQVVVANGPDDMIVEGADAEVRHVGFYRNATIIALPEVVDDDGLLFMTAAHEVLHLYLAEIMDELEVLVGNKSEVYQRIARQMERKVDALTNLLAHHVNWKE